jgi:NADPH:quinone reductase-like Zn-dependent oxidoreductase
MKAIQYRAYGNYAENKLVDLPAPAANDGQVLVRMRTVGINPLDNTFRSGRYRTWLWHYCRWHLARTGRRTRHRPDANPLAYRR